MLRNFMITTTQSLILLASVSTSPAIAEIYFSAEVSGQFRIFQQAPAFDEQQKNALSIAVKPRAVWFSEAGDDVISVELFARADQNDSDRSHVDIKEFLWDHSADDWVLRTGLGVVFWGVTESQHLIDVVNQVNALEGIDGEDKLGQPMVNLSLERDWGIVDLFWLPVFREQSFVGLESPLRPEFAMADDAQYESSEEDSHTDWAIRWSHYVDIYDFALSHFHGTQRSPSFLIDVSSGNPLLVPYYSLVDETSLMLQATLDAWLWKLEAKHVALTNTTAFLAVGGFEYSIYDIGGNGYDLGLISEYHFDDRGDNGNILENDLMIGARLAFNDVDSTEMLVGAVLDLDEDTRWISMEASKRFGDNWKGDLEVRLFADTPESSGLEFLNNDDFIQVEFSYFF